MKDKPLICGVGINDADYTIRRFEELKSTNGERVRKLVWRCPYFAKWKAMITRCYSPSHIARRPTYKDTSVCNDWLTFSIFKSWMIKQRWEGMQLDKDLLSDANIYSPENCIFISSKLNVFVIESYSNRNSYGVRKAKRGVKFEARCNDPFGGSDYIGSFYCEAEAQRAVLDKKYTYALKFAEIYKHDVRIVDALINRYKGVLK